jgi:hypothetical protein
MTRQAIATLVLTVALSAAGAAQTFKSRVESVRLDALVLDRGRPVLGLTADHFEIRDNALCRQLPCWASARCRWT